MQLTREKTRIVLFKNPSNHWEAGSVLNANVLVEPDGLVRMFYRATNDTRSGEAGGYVSSIGYAESRDGIHFERRAAPLLVPDQPYEQGLGCEDPRVTKLGDEYFIYYTAVEVRDGRTLVRIALATTKDFKTIQKHGIVGPAGTTSKAAVLLPEAANGQYIWYYTYKSDSPSSAIMHARFKTAAELKQPPAGTIAHTLEHADEFAVITAEYREGDDRLHGVVRGPEVGATPMKTEKGWLFIYCNTNTQDAREWQVSAALLSLDEPWKVIARSSEPLLKPETPEELGGVVNRVTFPAGALVMGDDLYVYYGSGDQGVCLATAPLNEVLDSLH